MKNVTVARRYAKALYELAVETKSVEDVLQGLDNIQTAVKNVPEIEKVLFNPIIPPEDKQKLIKTITSNKLILKCVALLAKRKRLDLLMVVREQVIHMNDEVLDIRRVLVKTASTLTDTHKKMIEKDLASQIGGKIIGQYQVAKELLGGVWIKMGDKVLDASLKGRIDDLRHALVHSHN